MSVTITTRKNWQTIGYPSILDDNNTWAWYDMNVDVTKDGSNRVSEWADRLGSGNDLAMATADYQPLWSSNGILFNGTDEYMLTGSKTLEQPEMIYIVFKHITWTISATVFDGYGGSTGRYHQFGDEGTPVLAIYAGTIIFNADLALDTWGIARVIYNGASSSYQVNTETADTGNAGDFDMGGFTLGNTGSAGYNRWSNIEVKEVIIREIVDSSENQTSIYNYLYNKYFS